jgi:hypothetical protein
MAEEGKSVFEDYANDTPRLLTRLQSRKRISEMPTREFLERIFETREKNNGTHVE